MSVERKKYECSALPKGWQREEVIRKSGLLAGKFYVYYFSPSRKKFCSKPQLACYLGDVLDLSTFDFRTGKINSLLLRKNKKQKGTQFDYRCEEENSFISLVISLPEVESTSSPSLVGTIDSVGSSRLNAQTQVTVHPLSKNSNFGSRGVRSDASLIPPIRQTASIFKQPVTVYKMQDGKVKSDFKHEPQEKPKQLFWEKRLEGLRACDVGGRELDAMELPRGLRAVGPHVREETLLQSVVTALHVSAQPVTGQTGSRSALDKNPGVFLNPDQPLVQAVTVADEDIKRQEERVCAARKKLEEALKELIA